MNRILHYLIILYYEIAVIIRWHLNWISRWRPGAAVLKIKLITQNLTSNANCQLNKSVQNTWGVKMSYLTRPMLLCFHTVKHRLSNLNTFSYWLPWQLVAILEFKYPTLLLLGISKDLSLVVLNILILE